MSEVSLRRKAHRVVTPIARAEFPMTGNNPRYQELCQKFAEELNKLEQKSGNDRPDHSNGNDTEEHPT